MTDLGQAPPIYEFSGFRLDVSRRQLRGGDDQPASLTVKVFDLLLYLVEHRGELVEKSALMQAVWPNVIVEENNLNQNISVLRKALGERAGEHRFIVTVPGRGFRFVAPVTVASGNGQTTKTAPLAMAHAKTPRIAILPFENLSPDPANAFFADGLHDEILSTLAQRAPDLQVISRTTMMRYRTNPAALPQIAAELNVNYVVEGTVRREGDQVRVTLQLIDARADRHLWAQSYERTLKSALTLQCEVASEVASRLAARFHGDTAAPSTNIPEAYDLYLRSRLLGQQVTPLSPVAQYTEVETLIERAIALDANSAAFYAQRAGFLSAKYGFNYDISEELRARIRADVEMAQRLAPGDPVVLAAAAGRLAWVEGDLQGAHNTFRAAVAAGLSDPLSLASYSTLLVRLNLDAEAIEVLERALALDPANPFLIAAMGLEYAAMQKASDGIRLLDRAISKYPERRFLRLVRGQVFFMRVGRLDEMRSELALATRHLPLLSLLDANFRVLVCAGAYDELQKLLDAIPDREVRVVPGPGGGGPTFGVGNRPMAQLRGWLALLQGESAAAARHGAEMLEFVAQHKPTHLNTWFLHLLTAEGNTFLGRRDPAIAAARNAIEALPVSRDRFGAFVIVSAAVILAWNAATDEAMTMLESSVGQLAFTAPGLVVRNPAFTQPLGKNARFRAYQQRLEATMQAELVAMS